jgi:hypothetical protein
MAQTKERLPWHVKAREWEDLKEYFLAKECYEMLPLIEHIEKSGAGDRLFGTTALQHNNTLIMGVYDPINTKKEALHIHLDLTQKQWVFRYFHEQTPEPNFERTYAVEKGIEKFDQVLRMVRW